MNLLGVGLDYSLANCLTNFSVSDTGSYYLSNQDLDSFLPDSFPLMFLMWACQIGGKLLNASI